MIMIGDGLKQLVEGNCRLVACCGFTIDEAGLGVR